MIIKVILSLVLAVMVTGLWTLITSKLATESPAKNQRITIDERKESTTIATKEDLFSLTNNGRKLFVEAVGVQSSQKKGEQNMSQDVLLFTQNIEAAKAEIESHGGRITQRFSPDVFVANLPQALDVSSLRNSQSKPHRELEPTEKVFVEAWEASIKKRETVPAETEGIPWDSPGYEPPGYDDSEI